MYYILPLFAFIYNQKPRPLIAFGARLNNNFKIAGHARLDADRGKTEALGEMHIIVH